MSNQIIERYKAILKHQDLWRSTPLLKVLSGRLQKMLARMEQEKKSVLPAPKGMSDSVTVYVDIMENILRKVNEFETTLTMETSLGVYWQDGRISFTEKVFYDRFMTS